MYRGFQHFIASHSSIEHLDREKLFVFTTATATSHPLDTVTEKQNDVDKGDVRVDAKAFGPKASECQVADLENGLWAGGEKVLAKMLRKTSNKLIIFYHLHMTNC